MIPNMNPVQQATPVPVAQGGAGNAPGAPEKAKKAALTAIELTVFANSPTVKKLF